ncbi:MAG: hypothetical protein P8P51_05215 [SAR86 cluster bacterium]|jgi:hypothetical protein|nr:hypothetical protein [SAR86 cluster bacterium]
MKPDINEALLNAAQEIIGRFSPLIEDEYERSRLGSWGALILISAMKFNDAGSALYKENEDIVIWLRDYTNLDSEELTNLDIKAYQDVSSVDKINQELRELLNREFMALEDSGDKVGIRSGLVLMRTMHQRRKVSDLIGLLQVPED